MFTVVIMYEILEPRSFVFEGMAAEAYARSTFEEAVKLGKTAVLLSSSNEVIAFNR